MSIVRQRRLAVLLPLVCLAAWPAAAQAAPPNNDAYLDSIPVNARGTELMETEARDSRDTTEATVQADMFSPQTTGGGAERTDCRGTTYGATVWYDVHPHADGVLRVQATGFDTAISVYEFDPVSALIGPRMDCSIEPGSGEELFVRVEGKKSYTIQIGGANRGFGSAVGALETTIEYLSDRDGDGELDALDKCPEQAGTASGCPAELRVLPTLRATPTSAGIMLRSLSVSVPKGARVQVRCGNGCAFKQSRTALKAGPVRFARLAGRRLPAGARLEIFVTKANSIGTYVRYTVTRGNFKRMVRCMRPSSTTPRRSCK